VNLKVEDYFQTGKRSLIRFREKGGKETEIPVHHKLEELLDRYLEISGLRNRPNAPLFPIALGKTRKLGSRQATRIDAARMLKRRLKDAGLSDAFSPHSFRATGITNFWRTEERWRSPSGSPDMLIAGQRSSMTDAGSES
jgi:integrase/recombinase XerD